MNNFNSFVDCEALRAQGTISLSPGVMRNIFFLYSVVFFIYWERLYHLCHCFFPFSFSELHVGFLV